jgi:hypothetical protein
VTVWACAVVEQWPGNSAGVTRLCIKDTVSIINTGSNRLLSLDYQLSLYTLNVMDTEKENGLKGQ